MGFNSAFKGLTSAWSLKTGTAKFVLLRTFRISISFPSRSAAFPQRVRPI